MAEGGGTSQFSAGFEYGAKDSRVQQIQRHNQTALQCLDCTGAGKHDCRRTDSPLPPDIAQAQPDAGFVHQMHESSPWVPRQKAGCPCAVQACALRRSPDRGRPRWRAPTPVTRPRQIPYQTDADVRLCECLCPPLAPRESLKFRQLSRGRSSLILRNRVRFCPKKRKALFRHRHSNPQTAALG